MKKLSAILLFLTPLTAAIAQSPAPQKGIPSAGTGQDKSLISWETLAKVKLVKEGNAIRPEFAKEIEVLDNKEIKIQGFMMPLEPGEKQKHFLLSINSPSCEFCVPAGPEGIVEVMSNIPVKFSFDTVLVSGKMTVLKSDRTSGLYYRMSDAVPALK